MPKQLHSLTLSRPEAESSILRCVFFFKIKHTKWSTSRNSCSFWHVCKLINWSAWSPSHSISYIFQNCSQNESVQNHSPVDSFFSVLPGPVYCWLRWWCVLVYVLLAGRFTVQRVKLWVWWCTLYKYFIIIFILFPSWWKQHIFVSKHIRR